MRIENKLQIITYHCRFITNLLAELTIARNCYVHFTELRLAITAHAYAQFAELGLSLTKA